MSNYIGVTVVNAHQIAGILGDSLIPDGHVGLVIGTGQSLILGTNSSPVLSAPSLSNAKMLQTTRTHMDSITAPANENTPFDPDLITTTPALAEAVSTNTSNALHETPLTGIASKIDPKVDKNVFYCVSGRGGMTYDTLNQNSWHFANACAYVDMIEKLTGKPVYHLLTIINHGESDSTANTGETEYKNGSVSWARDLNRFIQYKTGINSSPRTVISQCAATTTGSGIVNIQNAQLLASYISGFDLRVMYHLGYVDSAHLTNNGSREFGVDIGNGYNNKTGSIRPTQISVSGGTITIDVDETGLTTDSNITPDANHGFRLDNGTITSVTINDSSIDVDFTGSPSPTWISCAQNLTLTNLDTPDESQTDIWNGSERLCGFRLSTTWSAPALNPENPANGSHTLTAAEQAIVDIKGFVTWKKFANAYVSGTTLYCFGKTGNNATATGTIPSDSTINSKGCLDFGGVLHFISDRSEFPPGNYTVVQILRLDDANNNQIMCLTDGVNSRRFYNTTNTVINWSTGTVTTDSRTQATGSAFIWMVSYNYDGQEFKTRHNGGTTVTTSGNANHVLNPNQMTKVVYGAFMNSGTIQNKSTNTHLDTLIFARDIIEDDTYTAIENYANSEYGITIT